MAPSHYGMDMNGYRVAIVESDKKDCWFVFIEGMYRFCRDTYAAAYRDAESCTRK